MPHRNRHYTQQCINSECVTEASRLSALARCQCVPPNTGATQSDSVCGYLASASILAASTRLSVLIKRNLFFATSISRIPAFVTFHSRNICFPHKRNQKKIIGIPRTVLDFCFFRCVLVSSLDLFVIFIHYSEERNICAWKRHILVNPALLRPPRTQLS